MRAMMDENVIIIAEVERKNAINGRFPTTGDRFSLQSNSEEYSSSKAGLHGKNYTLKIWLSKIGGKAW